MIIVMKPKAPKESVEHIVNVIRTSGLEAHLSEGKEVTIIGVVGDKSLLKLSNLEIAPDVDKIVPITESYKLSNRKFHPAPTSIQVGTSSIGPDSLTVMAGPCAIESEEQLILIAKSVKKAGATFLRGGAYKPRTSTYSFQGLEEEGHHLRGHQRRIPGRGCQICGYGPDWGPEHAELPAAPPGGAIRDSGSFKAGTFLHHRRMAECGRIYHCGGQFQRGSMRAGHPHLRDCHPKHPGHQRSSRSQVQDPSSGDCGSQPRLRRAGLCAAPG